MSLLKTIIHDATIKAQTEEAEKAFAAGEAHAIVEGLHNIWNAELPELKKLLLKGDYREPVPFTEAQSKGWWIGKEVATGSNNKTAMGITVDLGARIEPKRLILRVTPRTRSSEGLITLVLDYRHRETPWGAWPLHTPPEVVMERLFSELARYVVLNTLPFKEVTAK